MGRLIRSLRAFPTMAAAVVLTMMAMLAAGAVLRTHANATLDRLRDLAGNADHVTDVGQELLIGLLDAESNGRAFLLSRRAVYLVPYTTARVSVLARLEDLQAAVQHLPALAPDLDAVVKLATARLGLLAAAMEAVQSGDQGSERQLLASDAGMATMRQARAVIERLIQRAEQERDSRSADEQRREEAVSIAVLLCGIAGVLLLGTASLALLISRGRLLRAQAALQTQSAQWQATVENLQDGVMVFDRAGGLVQWNANVTPLAGFATDLLHAGAPLSQFADAAPHWNFLLHTHPAPGVTPAATEIQAGGFVLELRRNAMPDGGQMLTIGDVTRRVDAEAIARQAQKMEVLGQLTGGVAHDFNNLLQVVSANLELLTARLDAPERPAAEWLRSRVTAAMEGVNRGARLTRHLLAFARRQPLAPEAVDAGRLLNGLDDMLRRTLGPTVAVEIVTGGGLWALRADSHELENVILNLAINGRDAMAGNPPGRAFLTIEASNAALDDAYCAQNADVLPGQYVVIAVTDCGCGMTQDQIARAMEPFYTTKAEGQGTGLGLSMAYGFAKQSGGHLKLYSEPGQGTTARLYIPRTTTQPQVQDATPAPVQPGQDELILLVEDDPAVRTSAALALRGLGYRVQEAGNADAAMDLLQGGLRPDLLFTDVMMPGSVGARAMAGFAQGRIPGLAVVFTSGYTENSIIHNGQLDPGIHLVSKPWRLEDLASRLRLALHQAQIRKSAPERLVVLLVEDDPLVRMITADMLADLGHAVIEAADADTALQQLDGVGVLITDIGLGETNGLALAAAARRRIPGLPVVVASGQPKPETGAEALFWLCKPYDNTALRRALECVVAGVVPVG